MARHNNKKIVVLNYKADIIGYYDSIKECAKINGYPESSLYEAVERRFVYKCMRFVSENEIRERWMNGTLDELKFKTLKERNIEKGRLIQKWMSDEVRKEKNSKTSLRHKALYKEGKLTSLENAIQSRRRAVRCIETGTEYPSITAAAMEHSVRVERVRQAALKGRKINGFSFELIERI